VRVLERIERDDGTLVRYEVRWKHSIFDDHAYGSHECWALVKDGRVVAATAEKHMPF
jgi:hypothetical protein